MRRYTIMAGLAALGISLSILAFVVVLGFERDRNRQEFEIKASNRTAAIRTELALHVNAVHSLQSLYSASETVSRDDFEIFVRNELSTRPAIQALEWIPRITEDAREVFESSMQAEGFTDYRIRELRDGEGLRPAADRSEYFPVAYVEPYSGNEAALGFDLASNPSRRQALKNARDSGDFVATQRVVLVQEVEEQFGFLVFVPIYKQGASIANVEERNEALTGFTLGVFRVDDLIASAWENAGLDPLSDDYHLYLVDRSALDESQSLLISNQGQGPDTFDSGTLPFTDSLSIGGRTWETTIIAQKESVFNIWQPWSALLAGLSLTAIAVAYLLLAMQRESRTTLLVEQRTRELSETNQQLEDEIVDRSRIQFELAGLYEISRIFSAEGDFQTKATQALEKVAELATADWVTLRLTKPDQPGLHLIAAAGPSVATHPPIPIFTEAMTMSTRAFTEGIIEVIDDYSARPAASEVLLNLGMRSMVILPVKSSVRILGLVTVISKVESHFNPGLVHLLASVGEGLGVLLDNSLLHEETEAARQEEQKLAQENALMAELGRIIGSSVNINGVYETLASQTKSLISFDYMDVTLIDETSQLDFVAFSTNPSTFDPGNSEGMPLNGSLTGLLSTTHSGLIIQNMTPTEIEKGYPCLLSLSEEGMNSFLAVPLIHHDVGIGALFLSSYAKSAFSQRDLDLATRIGHQVAGAISNARHYNLQIEAESALREREARLRGIVESAVDGIITIDEVGVVESFNSGAEAIFGYASLDVVGNNVNMLMTTSDYEAHDGYIKTYAKAGEIKIIGLGREVMGRRKDGSEFPMDLSVSEVDLGNRNIYTGIIRDITESKTLQREIEQRAKELEIAYAELKTLDSMKDEFIATVSHELRTPLTSIKGAAEILLNYRDEDRDTQTEFLSIIDNESDRLTRLINDVLDLARMDSGESVWDIASIDLKNVIATAMDSTHALVLNKRVTIEVDSGDDIPTVEADSDKLVQVVTNLLSNAIKFTPSGGWIRVNSRLLSDKQAVKGAKMVEVSVSDNGIGIPSGEVHKIFERFQQAGTTLADRPQGTGLGLAISREIITHLGGDIWVESEPGQGSTFFFTVPSNFNATATATATAAG